jgi:hypothetical protein
MSERACLGVRLDSLDRDGQVWPISPRTSSLANSPRTRRAATPIGINSETCCILLADHFSKTLDGTPLISKGAPLTWWNNWLLRNSLKVPNQYAYLDQGGELYKNPKVCDLFEMFGYSIRATGADSSHQNGPVDIAHLTISNALRTMLIGANLYCPILASYLKRSSTYLVEQLALAQLP